MATETVKVLIEGGKATAAPPLGPAMGPLGINIGEVVDNINKKTSAFKGMQVPVKVVVNTDTKEYEIEIGTPPASSLIKKEAGVDKGAANPKTDKVADLKIEQIIKIAKMKETSLLGRSLKEKLKEIIGTCNSAGILVEGVPAFEAIKLVNEGKFDQEIKEEKTELSAEDIKELEEEKIRLAEELKERREEFLAKAKEIVNSMAGKEPGEIKGKLRESEIPIEIIKEVMPEEEKPAEGEVTEKPAEGEATEKQES